MVNEVNLSVWHACAGITKILPLLSSSVYYIPQGHIENNCDSALVKTLCAQFPQIKCTVVSMNFLADQATDQVFAHMVLKPTEEISQTSTSQRTSHNQIRSGCIRVLKSCDFGRSINIQCFGVDLVFDKEDMDVSLRDIHNRVWNFRHTYFNGCHHLTEGSRDFMASKQLRGGDSLVFLRTLDDVITLGIRRAKYTGGTSDGFFCKTEEGRIQRTGNELCTVEALGEVMGKALRGHNFEVAYYPSPCGSHVLEVSTEFEKSVNVAWGVGMRVQKIGFVKHRLTRVSRYGMITSLIENPLSHWKQIKVEWDDTQMEESTNPWDIEVVPTVLPQKRRFEEITLMGTRIQVPRE